MNRLSHSFSSSKSALNRELILWGCIWAPCTINVCHRVCGSFKEGGVLIPPLMTKWVEIPRMSTKIDCTLLKNKQKQTTMALRDKNVLVCLSHPHFLKEWRECVMSILNCPTLFEQKAVIGQWHLVVSLLKSLQKEEVSHRSLSTSWFFPPGLLAQESP